MTSEERRARERAAVQERILNAARDLFIKDGYESVSLRKIAEAIEYTPPALYTHFSDKAELLRALCRRDFGALSEVITSVSRVTDPLERIMAIGHAYVRFAVEHPHHYRFMFMTKHPAEVGPAPEDLAVMNNPDLDGYAFLRQSVSAAIEAGLLRPEFSDAELGAQTLWAGVHGVASLEITMGADPCMPWVDLDARARAMCASLLRGMVREPGLVDAIAQRLGTGGVSVGMGGAAGGASARGGRA